MKLKTISMSEAKKHLTQYEAEILRCEIELKKLEKKYTERTQADLEKMKKLGINKMYYWMCIQQIKRLSGQTDQTLLEYFIKERLKNYKNPERAGKLKGEAIGASKKKYHAALLYLTDQKYQQIAQTVNTTAGTLHVWNTQENFKRLVEEHRSCLRNLIDCHLKTRIMYKSRLIDFYFRLPKNKKDGETPPRLDFNEFRDAQSYDSDFKIELIELYANRIKNNPNIPRTIYYRLEMFNLLCFLRKFTHLETNIKKEEKAAGLMLSSLLEDVLEALVKPKITTQEKKESILTLSSIINGLESKNNGRKK